MEERLKIIEEEQMQMVKLMKIMSEEIKYLNKYVARMGKLPELKEIKNYLQQKN